MMCPLEMPVKLCLSVFSDQKRQDGEGMSAAAAEEPAVSGTLHLPHPLQHIPAPREERLLAALLHSLDGTGTRSLLHCCCRLQLFFYSNLSLLVHFMQRKTESLGEMYSMAYFESPISIAKWICAVAAKICRMPQSH